MANYGRNTGDMLGDISDIVKGGTIPTLLTGMIGLIGVFWNISEKQDIEHEMKNCDRRISELRSGFLGSWLNSDEIEAEKNKRAELQNKYDKKRK